MGRLVRDASGKVPVKYLTCQKSLNKLFQEWAASGDQATYNKLLQAVLDNTFVRFVKIDGYDTAEIIASMVGMKIYRALPGYLGPRPLKPYDPKRGEFYSFVSTMARTTRLDYFKRRTAGGVGELEVYYAGSDYDLAGIEGRLNDPWDSEGRKRTKKTPPDG